MLPSQICTTPCLNPNAFRGTRTLYYIEWPSYTYESTSHSPSHPRHMLTGSPSFDLDGLSIGAIISRVILQCLMHTLAHREPSLGLMIPHVNKAISPYKHTMMHGWRAQRISVFEYPPLLVLRHCGTRLDTCPIRSWSALRISLW